MFRDVIEWWSWLREFHITGNVYIIMMRRKHLVLTGSQNTLSCTNRSCFPAGWPSLWILCARLWTHTRNCSVVDEQRIASIESGSMVWLLNVRIAENHRSHICTRFIFTSTHFYSVYLMSYWMLNCYKNVFKMLDIQKKARLNYLTFVNIYLYIYTCSYVILILIAKLISTCK